MDDQEKMLLGLVLVGAGLVLLCRCENSKRWANRRWWVRPINCQRNKQGDYKNLLQEMKADSVMFFRYTQMTLPLFKNLLEKIRVPLMKRNWRALEPEQRLAITLRYLATGDLPLSIALAYRIGESTVYKVVKETCSVLINVLTPLYLRTPTREKWLKICHGFWSHWNFPNCVGAVDGKHVQINAPLNFGRLYYNYKKTFSIVLMAACDHEYKFRLVDVGAYGSNNDAGVFSRSNFGQALVDGKLDLPAGRIQLPGSNAETHCFFVGDEALHLSKNLMRPYSGRNLPEDKTIFNYRLSRSRRTIENSFGILAARWRIFTRPISLHPNSADIIIMACLCLHNFLMTENNRLRSSERTYCPNSYIDTELENGDIILGEWRNENSTGMQHLQPSSAHRARTEAYTQRDILKDYCLTADGEVSWQYVHVRRGFTGADHSQS